MITSIIIHYTLYIIHYTLYFIHYTFFQKKMSKRDNSFPDRAGKKQKVDGNSDSESDIDSEWGDLSELASQITVTSSPEAGPSSFKCDYCPSRFESREDLNEHKKSVHRNKLHQRCDFCEEDFLHYYGKF